MRLFNGRAATEEYMSTHSLTFSTPEMTLKKFVLWLGEPVSHPGSKEQVPRLMLYIEEKTSSGDIRKEDHDLMPDTDDTFRPSGAVTEMYSGISSSLSGNEVPPPKKDSVNKTSESDTKFCFACGSKLKINSKFCRNCGTRQD
jgi:ribosomal protein L40E